MGFPDFYSLGVVLTLLCVVVIGDVLFLTVVAAIRCWNRRRERRRDAAAGIRMDESQDAAPPLGRRGGLQR